MKVGTRTAAARAVAAVMALVAGVPAAAQSLQPATFIPLAISVVRVEAEHRSQLDVGSGVTVAPGIVVTNCHVTRDAEDLRITGAGMGYAVTGQIAFGTHDVCFLRVPGWKGRAVRLADHDALRVGAPVAAIGYNGGAERSFNLGRVRGLHSFDGGRIIETDAGFTGGASGGALFDADGRLVGLLAFLLRRADASYYYALPAAWISDGLPRADARWNDVGPLHDAAPFWEREASTQPYFLRAYALAADQSWPALAALCSSWIEASPTDEGAYRMRGRALLALGRSTPAIDAYRQAVRIAPDDAAAWYGLGLAYSAIEDVAATRNAESRTATLDPELGARLRRQLDERAHR